MPLLRCGADDAAAPAIVVGSRAVAQLGSALDWGSRGRRFKSCQPDMGKDPGDQPWVLSYVGGLQQVLDQAPIPNPSMRTPVLPLDLTRTEMVAWLKPPVIGT